MFCAFLLAVLALVPGVLNSSPSSDRVQKSTPAQPVNAAAQQVLTDLQNANQAEIATKVSRQTGAYNFVNAPSASVLTADKMSAASPTRAMAFLATYGALVGMNNAERNALHAGELPAEGSNLQVLRSETDGIGMSHVRFNQFYKGLRVVGGQVIVHMNDKGITGVNGHYVPEISLSTLPALTEAAAAENAVAILRKGGDKDLKVNKAELAIYPVGLLEGASVVSRLAYAVDVSGSSIQEQVWIDAQTGGVLNRIPLHHSAALNRIIYTPQYGEPFDVRHEGDPYTPGPPPGTAGADPINNLYLFAEHTYNLLRSGFAHNSYDNMGHTMHSVYLVNNRCPNAYWNGISTNYCPDLDADDVVAHEWGHAYTQFTHGLIYSYQSGALNESYSDIFGETTDLLNGVDAEGGSNNTQPMPTGQRWQIGEDVNVLNQPALGILRDMWDPTRFGQPDKTSSPNYSCGSGDSGGVHANSGVPNHAYAILVDGKTFNGQTVTGIGFNRALAIYYRAMTVYQTETTDFAAHSQALQQSCADLIGDPLNVLSTSSANGVVSTDVVTLSTCQQVTKAMQAVEMNLPTPCPILILLNPDAPAACDGASDIFAEDWETGDNGWTRTSTGVFAEWEDSTRNLRDFLLDSTLPAGRSGTAAQARNIPLGEPGGGDCSPGTGDYSGQFTIDSPTIAIPAGASDLKMRFDHYVATEATFDGGQVEISVNGGAFQLVPQDQYEFNKPNSQFEPPPPVGLNTNPNAGEYAWHGTNVNVPSGTPPGSWGTTIIDLSSLTNPGDTMKVRFTYSQDGCNGVDGWYVDNVRVYACPTLTGPTLTTGPDYENPDTNGSFTLIWTRPAEATGPDVLQVSETSCAPLLFDNAESGTGQWTVANDGAFSPTWTTSNAKPQHAPNTAFWAAPASEQGFDSATLTYNNPITIPSSGITKLSFLEWYFNEDDDSAFVEVSTNNGATWTAVYTNARPMGDLPDTGADSYANEPLSRQEIDLTVYSGQTIRLRFRYFQGASDFVFFVQYGWYIDDILMTNDSWLDVASTFATSFTDHKPSGSYCYRVRTTYTFGTQRISSEDSNVVDVTVATGVPRVVSRKDHTPAGTFDVDLPTVGSAGIECRKGGGVNSNTHQVVFQFSQPATFTGATVTPGPGKTAELDGPPTGNATNNVTVNLKNVSNAQTLTVTLQGANAGAGPTNMSVPMSVLLGDTNANGAVNTSDIGQAKAQSGLPTSGSNFRLDVTTNGAINTSDIGLIKSQSGTVLP